MVKTFETEKDVRLAPGQSIALAGYDHLIPLDEVLATCRVRHQTAC